MKIENEFTLTIIKCPDCDHFQAAIVEHTFPYYTYIHDCVNCGYIIMESEWDSIKPLRYWLQNNT